jgi:hypothetical protein
VFLVSKHRSRGRPDWQAVAEKAWAKEWRRMLWLNCCFFSPNPEIKFLLSAHWISQWVAERSKIRHWFLHLMLLGHAIEEEALGLEVG